MSKYLLCVILFVGLAFAGKERTEVVKVVKTDTIIKIKTDTVKTVKFDTVKTVKFDTIKIIKYDTIKINRKYKDTSFLVGEDTVKPPKPAVKK